jgi:hypothetical protein
VSGGRHGVSTAEVVHQHAAAPRHVAPRRATLSPLRAHTTQIDAPAQLLVPIRVGTSGDLKVCTVGAAHMLSLTRTASGLQLAGTEAGRRRIVRQRPCGQQLKHKAAAVVVVVAPSLHANHTHAQTHTHAHTHAHTRRRLASLCTRSATPAASARR